MNENINDTLDQQWRVKSFTKTKFLHTKIRDYFGKVDDCLKNHFKWQKIGIELTFRRTAMQTKFMS